ncbi:MAG: TetR/AcrR family transcriptional regulator [Endozoicomonas sp.]
MARYHHGNLRQELLSEALKQLELQGIDSLSLRALARAVGVSQTAPYRHFPDKTALLIAMAVEGFQDLKALMEKSVKQFDQPDQRLPEMGLNYVEFACENPHLYKLMFGPTLAAKEDYPELEEAAKECFRQLQNVISQIMPSADPEHLWYMTANASALVRGHASMRIDGIMACNLDTGEDLDLRKALTLFLAHHDFGIS